jgi:hypothetical protein
MTDVEALVAAGAKADPAELDPWLMLSDKLQDEDQWTESTLHRLVCLHPKHDGPRILYATRLEENAGAMCAEHRSKDCPKYPGGNWVSDGRKERAEFIRVQVEVARCGPCPATIYHPRFDEPDYGGKMYVAPPPQRPKEPCGWCPVCVLRRRERELLAAHGFGWCDGLLGPEWKTDGISKTGGTVTVRYFSRQDARGYTEPFAITFSRGFVSELTLSATDWLAHADALVWREGLADGCPECGNVSAFGCRDSCPRCDGTGTVPRPPPPTAQPIERVTFIDDPRDSDHEKFGEFHRVLKAETGLYFWRYNRWPTIEFNFPVEDTE